MRYQGAYLPPHFRSADAEGPVPSLDDFEPRGRQILHSVAGPACPSRGRSDASHATPTRPKDGPSKWRRPGSPWFPRLPPVKHGAKLESRGTPHSFNLQRGLQAGGYEGGDRQRLGLQGVLSSVRESQWSGWRVRPGQRSFCRSIYFALRESLAEEVGPAVGQLPANSIPPQLPESWLTLV
jgi:hypothetical protein